jgi:hypothetical protein
MFAVRPDFYAEWRARNEARLLLREAGSPQPSERVLQSVWRHQRLRRDDLKTLDGRTVRVLHPGFWNKEAGPDFRGAVVQIGNEPARSGDIEIDLVDANWRAHQHHDNPNYKDVILHVVWSANDPAKTGERPILALEPSLDSPLAELQSWADSPAAESWPAELHGACAAPLRQLSSDQAQILLAQAATVRLQRKARELEIRARQSGWEQALWEGIFRALGYKQNVWPMQRLAELRERLTGDTASVLHLQARLFGVGGLLPADAPLADSYLRSLWDRWWRDREHFADAVLPKTLWRFNGLRPANQPQRRLALAAHWLTSENIIDKLEHWFADERQELSPLAILQPASDDFWSWHWGFSRSRLPKPQPLLGESRATDLAINVLLPWFWARAQAGKNETLQRRAEQKYLAWPAAQDNSVLRLARQRLFGQPSPRWLNTAAAQQGLLQIVRDFCQHTNALCADCLFPDLTREFALKS